MSCIIRRRLASDQQKFVAEQAEMSPLSAVACQAWYAHKWLRCTLAAPADAIIPSDTE